MTMADDAAATTSSVPGTVRRSWRGQHSQLVGNRLATSRRCNLLPQASPHQTLGRGEL